MRFSGLVRLFRDQRTSYRALSTLAAAILCVGALVSGSWGLAAAGAVLTLIGVAMTRQRMSDSRWE